MQAALSIQLKIFILAILLHTVNVFTDSIPSNLNIYFSGANAHVVAQADARNATKQDMKTMTHVDVKHTVDFDGLKKGVKALCCDASSSIYEIVKNNTKNCIGITVVASYIWITYRLRKGQSVMQDRDAWCNWKQVVALSHLYATPYEELIQQMIFDIRRKYFLGSDQKDPLGCYTRFIKDIEREMEILEICRSWYQMLSSIYCSKLFYFKYDCARIEDKKLRLQFILDIFIRWQMQK